MRPRNAAGRAREDPAATLAAPPPPSKGADAIRVARWFGQPSTYSLSPHELAAHVRQLRRQGWQPWEVRARFDFGRRAA